MTAYGMQLKDAEELISSKLIISVLAEQQDNGEWAFFITFRHPEKNTTDTIYIERQRSGMRTWADPRKMFELMFDSFGIREGTFKTKLKRDKNV